MFFRLLIILLLALPATAATFNVNTIDDTQDFQAGDGVCADNRGRCSFRAAITESNALFGTDTIFVPAGTYNQTLVAPNENANAGGDWDIIDNTFITGPGGTFLQPADAAKPRSERVLDIINPGTQANIYNMNILNGVTVQGSESEMVGGGIRNNGILYIYNVYLTANTAFGGGGIHSTGSLTAEVSRFGSNRCFHQTDSCRGGGIGTRLRSGETVEIIDSLFEGNQANVGTNFNGSGGAMAIYGLGSYTLNIRGSRFWGNSANGSNNNPADGAGVMIGTAAGTVSVTISSSSFKDQFFTSNLANVRGAGINMRSSGSARVIAYLDRLTFANNAAGAASPVDGTFGGHMYVQSGGAGMDLSIRTSNFHGGRAHRGGAIFYETDTDFKTPSTLLITNSSFVANGSQTGDGGGVYLSRSVESRVPNTTFNFCTFSRNTAVRGSAIYSAGTAVLKNSIIDYHAGTAEIQNALSSGGYNHFEGVPGANVTLTASDAVGYTGLVYGPGSTYLVPLPSSPVVNTIPLNVNGCGNAVNTDQLLKPRPYNAACDKGAIELQQLPVGSVNW